MSGQTGNLSNKFKSELFQNNTLSDPLVGRLLQFDVLRK